MIEPPSFVRSESLFHQSKLLLQHLGNTIFFFKKNNLIGKKKIINRIFLGFIEEASNSDPNIWLLDNNNPNFSHHLNTLDGQHG